MKNNLQTMKRVATASGFLIGAFALSVFAQSTWVAPPASPPTCSDPNIPGCNAPINVGTASQSKLGLLGLKNFLFKPDANPVRTGAVLAASDANGTVGWSLMSNLFYFKRSDVHTGDSVVWCPATHPNVVSCSTVDDQAPAASEFGALSNPCLFSGSPRLSDGPCEGLDTTRTGLGPNHMYFETVRKLVVGPPSVIAWGCMAYDHLHTHAEYKVDLICMQ